MPQSRAGGWKGLEIVTHLVTRTADSARLSAPASDSHDTLTCTKWTQLDRFRRIRCAWHAEGHASFRCARRAVTSRVQAGQYTLAAWKSPLRPGLQCHRPLYRAARHSGPLGSSRQPHGPRELAAVLRARRVRPEGRTRGAVVCPATRTRGAR